MSCDTKTLPDTLSGLIDVALTDLRAIEQDKRYVVDMIQWHRPAGGRCYVCLAGAVMAQELGVALDAYCWPSTVSDDLAFKLLALEYLRSGKVRLAMDYMKLAGRYDLDRSIADYHADRDQFFADMEKLASDLRAAGL